MNKNVMGRPPRLSRNLMIIKLRDKDNLSLSELGKQFGLSRQRVSIIINKDWSKYIKIKNYRIS